MPIQTFSGGKPSVRDKLNQLVVGVNGVQTIAGDPFIGVRRNGNAIALGLNINEVVSRVPKTPGGSSWVWGVVVAAPEPTGIALSVKLAPPPSWAPIGNAFDVSCITICGDGYYENIGHLNHVPYLLLGNYVRITNTPGEGVWYVADPFIDVSLIGSRLAEVTSLNYPTNGKMQATLCYSDGTVIPGAVITVRLHATAYDTGRLKTEPDFTKTVPQFVAGDKILVKYRTSTYWNGYWWDGIAAETEVCP